MNELNERQLTEVSAGDKWCLEEAALTNSQNGQINYASHYMTGAAGISGGPGSCLTITYNSNGPGCPGIASVTQALVSSVTKSKTQGAFASILVNGACNASVSIGDCRP